MRVRLIYAWWLGVALFSPSIVFWGFSLYVGISKRMIDWALDRETVFRFYLPLVGTAFGFFTPLICLRWCKRMTNTTTAASFVIYLAAILCWGIADIRAGNYQLGGHDYPNDIHTDGHRHYWHAYYTWYFLPEAWIEKGGFHGE